MKKPFTLICTCAAIALALPGFSQAPAMLQPVPMPTASPDTSPGAILKKSNGVIKKKLPDDLPQEKLLFVKYQPLTLPPEGPKGWGIQRRNYFLKKKHNDVFPEANKQLQEAAKLYPYAHRITTLDSVAYYQEHGYKYMLMQSSFNSVADGTFQGTTGNTIGTGSPGGSTRVMTTTSVDLYVQELNSGDKYVFDDFSETFIYYYKGQVGMLLKKVDKQFNAKKKS
ncbi:hypothetical protein [Hymenobacter properus]|uniref:Uncharacterized protein n=1 Tax=Hymenobacter properus TaxID=2791026 RepID=A0A931BB32_9BACT|nr:hypothetical protein [Hymenobacter properus]MBF9140600.1 hypothetical protein [Hymenobacter properus]MBR7719408.1 hypothetical protein [Microvirga sp. SRT04]